VSTMGPVPKPRSELLGHVRKLAVNDSDQVPMVGVVKPPGLPKRENGQPLHEVARRWYRALRRSSQAQFYEPTDWALAVFVAHEMDMVLSLGALGWSPNAVTVVMKAAESLLATEGSRRRARIETKRSPSAADKGQPPKPISDHRDRAAS
jgi:hypothetical protein